MYHRINPSSDNPRSIRWEYPLHWWQVIILIHRMAAQCVPCIQAARRDLSPIPVILDHKQLGTRMYTVTCWRFPHLQVPISLKCLKQIAVPRASLFIIVLDYPRCHMQTARTRVGPWSLQLIIGQQWAALNLKPLNNLSIWSSSKKNNTFSRFSPPCKYRVRAYVYTF